MEAGVIRLSSTPRTIGFTETGESGVCQELEKWGISVNGSQIKMVSVRKFEGR